MSDGGAGGAGDGDPVADSFIESFRASAPYIHAHRGRTFVVALGGEAAQSDGLRELVHDVALLHALGIRLVLVVGARPQIEQRLAARGLESRYVRDLRVTDDDALVCVKEAGSTVRLEMEALLSMGLPNSPMAGARIRVATGNFVVARPVGVVDGVDCMHTGEVRRVDSEAIRQRLDDGAVVLLTPIGYSATGEVFNVSTHEVGAAVAVALGADKLVCLVEGRGVVDGAGQMVHELDPNEASEIIDSRRLAPDVARHLRASVDVCRQGVRRAHLVPRSIDGALLRELFTRDGAGTLVTNETFEDIRAARWEDVGGILELIEPLEKEGNLARRSRELLETDIDRFVVIERDGMVVACAALYPYPEDETAELACVGVHPKYRQAARGNALLQYIERRCRAQGIETLFALTTRTAHWFRERGFEPGSLEDVPELRRRSYDPGRNSKVLVKTLKRTSTKR